MIFLIYSIVTFFFNDTATTEIYTYLHTLSLHDALPIFGSSLPKYFVAAFSLSTSECGSSSAWAGSPRTKGTGSTSNRRSEEHTSELQSLMRISYAVFCLKKKTKQSKARNNKNKHKIADNM